MVWPYFCEKALGNNNYLVRRIGIDRTQVLHRMRLRHFTPQQPIPDVQITPRQRKHEPEVIINHDYLYARAWECEHHRPIYDNDHNVATPNSPKIAARSNLAADETNTLPGTIREISPEILPQADRLCDVTDTDHYLEPDADTSVEQPPNPTPTNPRSKNCGLRHTPKPIAITNTDIHFLIRPAMFYAANVHLPEILGRRYKIDMRNAYTFFLTPSSLCEKTIEQALQNDST